MRKLICAAALSVTLMTASVFCFAQGDTQDTVRGSFDGYKAAILESNGEQAIKYVDAKSIEYYVDILDTIKYAGKSEVNDLSILDKMMVFIVRNNYKKEDILPLNGREFFIKAINDGMVGKNSVEKISIGRVVINGDYAMGYIVHEGIETPLYVNFFKEDGEWRFSLISVMPMGEKSMAAVIKMSGEKENDFLLSLVEMTSSNKPGNEIWKPMAKKNKNSK